MLTAKDTSSQRTFALVAMLAGIALAPMAAATRAAAQGPPPASVRVDPVRSERVQEHRLITGELRAVQRSRVAAEEPGIVLEVPVEQGLTVRKGALLARLDSRRLEIELQQADADWKVAQAAVGEREADLEWRRRDLQNYQSLAAGGAGKAKELYDAEMQTRIADAKLVSAQRAADAIAARLDLLKQRIADTTIVAPFEGVIVAKLVEAGEWLAEGAPVIEMISTGSVDVWLDVPQQYAQAIIGRQTTVAVNVEAMASTIETSNLRVIPQVDAKARTFSLIARLESAAHLTPGMSATAWVPTGEEGERLTISRDAILRNSVGSFVYVARVTDPKAPASALPADVQVLFSAGGRVVVQSLGLQPGDLLIVEGNERLFPTAPVIPMPHDAEQAAQADAASSHAAPVTRPTSPQEQ